jgi:hypothetical protein
VLIGGIAALWSPVPRARQVKMTVRAQLIIS